MFSTVKCSQCERSTTKTDNTQYFSLYIDEDANLSLEDSLHDFFQLETTEGENAYWCDTCKKTCRATKTLSYTRSLNKTHKMIDSGERNTDPYSLGHYPGSTIRHQDHHNPTT